jgi:hypothetical protein
MIGTQTTRFVRGEPAAPLALALFLFEGSAAAPLALALFLFEGSAAAPLELPGRKHFEDPL